MSSLEDEVPFIMTLCVPNAYKKALKERNMKTDTQKFKKPKKKNFFRRNLVRIIFYSLPLLCMLYGFFIEPHLLMVKEITVGNPGKTRILHFTDLHYKGDKKGLDSLIDEINELKPDIVCFTGDILEKPEYLDEALEGIAKIKAPLYGIPGNHDYWSGINLSKVEKIFNSTGGAWLPNRSIALPDKNITISGVKAMESSSPLNPNPGTKHILLTHYPAYVEELGTKYDLILAGHSHGGQVRIPFYGALITPNDTGEYEKGLYETDAGPLYVNPGIGYFMIPVRFFCPPELTLITF